MSALNPSIRRLEKLRIPRWLAIMMIYLVILIILGLGLWGIVPPLVDQTSALINKIPDLFRKFNFWGIDEKILSSQLGQLTSVPVNLIKFITNVFSNLVEIFALAVLTFYLLLERKKLDQYLVVLFGEEKEKEIEKTIRVIEGRLGSWVRGELFLMLIVGILDYIGFRIIGLDFALPLAILAFILEIVPTIGPTLSALPAIMIALVISPFHALATAGWCFLVQQLENSIFVPRVMKKVAGVNPLISILSLAIGLKLAGIGGALLAIPTFIVIEVIVREILTSR
jgi:predicted PurR-regulated permease PerM